MAFLFQDQNQGTRNVGAHANPHRVKRRKPFSFIRTVTVGFGVAPNLLTLPFGKIPFQEDSWGKALAGLGLATLTAGGDFHPALRTSAARDERPDRKYDAARPPQQARSASKTAWSHAAMTGVASPGGIND